MVFAIGVFGNLFNGMLNTCLYSIYKNSPNSHVFIFWQDVESPSFQVIKEAYPNVTFLETKFNLVEKFQRRGSKMLFWEAAALELMKQGYSKACFMDVDTLVLRDINHFFDDEFDVAFSVKDERWPLNTGVMLMQLSERVLGFVTKWKEQSFANIRIPENYTKAKSHQFPYGGPDQMAFHTLLSFRTDKLEYDLDGIKLKGFDSKHFNETKSTKVTDHTHIIHYKGGWQKVLVEGKSFSKKRTLKDSKEMYILYMTVAKEGLAFVNRKMGTRFLLSHIGIASPKYLNESLGINHFTYSLWQFRERVQVFIENYYGALLRKVKKS